eukprot:9586931-Ditylum_brightwellii.AAC.2
MQQKRGMHTSKHSSPRQMLNKRKDKDKARRLQTPANIIRHFQCAKKMSDMHTSFVRRKESLSKSSKTNEDMTVPFILTNVSTYGWATE